MNKYLFTATFFVAFSLCSKTFELCEPEFDSSTYQNCIVEKSPVSSVISEYGIENFNYDSFGNLIQDKDKTFSYNDYGQISEITYNDGKKVKLSYDAFGRLTQNGNSSFEYNDFNMMSRLTNPYFQAEYSYDQKTGYRSSKTVNGVQYDFTIDDNGNLIEQTDSLGNTSLISWNNSLPETLTYNGTRYNFVCNDHGDVTALTDLDGNVVNSYEYDIYGKILSESESVPNPIRYAHEYYDSESGLYYLRGRYYNPETKSFTTADPAEADSKLYAYTGYNPIEFIDPSGYAVIQKKDEFGRTMIIISEEDLKKVPKMAHEVLSSTSGGVKACDTIAVILSMAGTLGTFVSLLYSAARDLGLFSKPEKVVYFWETLSDVAMEAYRLDDVVRIITNEKNDEVIVERYNEDAKLVCDDYIFVD